jgi:general secretion pathway protein G
MMTRIERLRASAQRQRQRGRDTRGGFTLVELLVVLVILGLVMGLVGPRVLGYLSSSRERTAHLQIESFASALDLFYLDYGRYPTNSEGLDALVHKPGSGDRWAGPYLKQANVPKDPWGNPYAYHVPGKTGPYAISSPGPEGTHGGIERAAIGNE